MHKEFFSPVSAVSLRLKRLMVHISLRIQVVETFKFSSLSYFFSLLYYYSIHCFHCLNFIFAKAKIRYSELDTVGLGSFRSLL